MHQPLRMAPGTRMPQAFVDGRSTLSTVLDGDPKGQAEAMWSYLSLGPGLPLPEGLEPPKGLIIAVKDRPQVLADIHAGCRLEGDRNRLSRRSESRVLGRSVPAGVCVGRAISSMRRRSGTIAAGRRRSFSGRSSGPHPPDIPWGLTTNPRIPPDFAARVNNPAFGFPLPLEPARTYDGPMAVHFDGYSLDKSGLPTFRYSLSESGKNAVLAVAEKPVPITASVATGFRREFAVEVPAGGYRAWLLAGQTAKQPRVVSATGGKAPELDLKSNEPLVTAEGTRVVLPQAGDRAIVLEAAHAPAGTEWRFVPMSGGGWQAILRLPEAKNGWKGTFEVAVWALPKDDDALMKDLSTK